MSLAIDEAIPRHQPDNPYNYSNLEIAQRKKALLDMKKDYPNLPDAWLEMAYDFHEHTPKEEIEETIPQLSHCVAEPMYEEDNYKMVYQDIHNYHIAATQELYKLVLDLQARIAVLESK